MASAGFSDADARRSNQRSFGGNVNGNGYLSRSLVFVIATVTVTSGGILLDYLLLQNGLRLFDVLLVSNVFMAATAATSLLVNNLHQLEKQRALADRLETLLEMDRNLRSALTAIAFYGKQTDNDPGMRLVSETLGRMDDSFRSVAARWKLIPERQAEFKLPQTSVLRNVLKFRRP
jgi:ABC-type uncharacterized transport system fused permease/ATPase subunit